MRTVSLLYAHFMATRRLVLLQQQQQRVPAKPGCVLIVNSNIETSLSETVLHLILSGIYCKYKAVNSRIKCPHYEKTQRDLIHFFV